MAVSCTYSPGFGVKITVGLPRHVGREAGFELCDAIDALIRERLDENAVQGQLSPSSSGSSLKREIGEKRSEPSFEREVESSEVARYVSWPRSGKVSLKMIAAAWNIGSSTFRMRVSEGKVSLPEVIEGRTDKMAKLWDVEKITPQLLKLGITRRFAK